MKLEQLELDLWEQLQLAHQVPEASDVVQVLDAVEATVEQLPEAERLRLAGEALLRVAELCATRADLLMSEWEESYRDPVVQQGFFDDLVRQTMAVDLGELMELTPPRKSRAKRVQSTQVEEGSIVGTVDKVALLAMVDQLESEEIQREQVLAIADDEDLTRWVEAISQSLQALPGTQAYFTHLCQSLRLQPVEVWLGVLLGGFEVKQQGEFYSDLLLIKGTA